MFKISFYKNANGWKYLAVSLAVIILDQLTKGLIRNNIELNSIGYSVTPFFSIVHVHNEGAAFSFLSDAGGWQRYFFLSVSSLISVFLFFYLLNTDKAKKYTCISVTLILGGAIGNLIDRAVMSYVEDFLLFYLKTSDHTYVYPAFNVADIAVCVGAFLLVLISIFTKENK